MQYLSAILPLFSGILFLCLGGTVFFLSKGRLRKVFLRFCFITFYWQLSWVVLFLLNSREYSDLICRIGYSGIIFLPLSGYETIVHYLKLPSKHIRILYIICFGFLVSLWTTDLFIQGAHRYAFGYYPKAGILHVAYMIMVVFLVTRNAWLLFSVYRKETDSLNKNQLVFFFLAINIFSFSAVDYVLNYPFLVEKLNIQIYPFGVFFITFSVMIFILCHFMTLNLNLEKRVAEKTLQLKTYVHALEEAANTKKDFIANVTHELRTPLTLIRGWTDYIISGELGKIPEHFLEIIHKVSLQTLNLTEKINELLKISKFDAGMGTLSLYQINVDDHIFQIVSSFRELTDRSGIELQYTCEPEIKDIFIDREKLKDILNNLIRNAYKFTEKGRISVTVSNRNGMIIIRVRDTGIGMSPELIQKAFQRFQQGDGSKTRQYEGTGLGLAIVKESVEMMHGRITAESVENQWTCFTVEIPANLEILEPGRVVERRKKERRAPSQNYRYNERRKKDRRDTDLAGIGSRDIIKIAAFDKTLSSSGEVKKIEPPNSTACIIIAEDNPGIQEFLGRALKGYTLFMAPNGQAAWETIQHTQPDLIISDIMMPVMDGYSLLENIRLHKATTHIPVIMITSLTEQEDRIKSLQMGADDFLTKPFHHLELQARVKNVISVHKLEREKTRTEQLEVFLMVLASAIESKDQYTGGHVERVANFARDLARKANLSEDHVKDIYMGTIVHDVGKIGIKDEVLNKPGKLTDEEFEHIKEHSVIGKNLLSKLEIAPIAVSIAYNHQEKWDGTGYPRGIRREEIPIEARIATIADVWDAITSDRPYRTAIPIDKAIRIMHEERGKSFDPDLFDLFMDEKDKLYLRYINTQLFKEVS